MRNTIDQLYILTGPDGAGKSTIFSKVGTNLANWALNNDIRFFAKVFPSDQTKQLLTSIPEGPGLARHKLFEVDFENFSKEYNDMRKETKSHPKHKTIVFCDRMYPCNMAYSLFFNPETPEVFKMFDFTERLPFHLNVSIIHIYANSTLWREKYDHDERREEMRDQLEMCYQKAYHYLLKKHFNVSVNVIYNNYDGKAEEEVEALIRNV